MVVQCRQRLKRCTFQSTENLITLGLNATATITVDTKDCLLKYLSRRRISLPRPLSTALMDGFSILMNVKKINEKIYLKSVKILDNYSKCSANVRLVVVSLVCGLRKPPKMQFNCREFASLAKVSCL